jgi:murein DD-endopeptidase MepM/ murein hydrolase activator NlpD
VRRSCFSFLACGCGGSSHNQNNFVVDCSVYPPQATSSYVLPYLVDTSYVVSATTTQHHASNRYAVDFVMPIGTIVAAARSGIVYDVHQQYYDNDHAGDHGNYVFVLHEDNTLGLYGHLTHNGALVNIGDPIWIGQPIGLSGNSGASNGPHLHFETTSCTVPAWSNGQNCPAANWVSMPTSFRNTTPVLCGLQVGVSYPALEY